MEEDEHEHVIFDNEYPERVRRIHYTAILIMS